MPVEREIPDDEIVAKNSYIHLERMNHDEFFLIIDDMRYRLYELGGEIRWVPEEEWWSERSVSRES